MADYTTEVKLLKNEVQLLRDELAVMKRKYEDIIYNLDTENFSSRFTKEQKDMRASIEFTAEGIKTKVSNEEFQSAMTQTANQIATEVSSLDSKLSSKITQTSDSINATVSELSTKVSSVSVKANSISTRVENMEEGEFNGYTLFEQTYDKLTITVDGTKVVIEESGQKSGTITLAPGTHEIVVSYSKDHIYNKNDDIATIKFIKPF